MKAKDLLDGGWYEIEDAPVKFVLVNSCFTTVSQKVYFMCLHKDGSVYAVEPLRGKEYRVKAMPLTEEFLDKVEAEIDKVEDKESDGYSADYTVSYWGYDNDGAPCETHPIFKFSVVREGEAIYEYCDVEFRNIHEFQRLLLAIGGDECDTIALEAIELRIKELYKNETAKI